MPRVGVITLPTPGLTPISINSAESDGFQILDPLRNRDLDIDLWNRLSLFNPLHREHATGRDHLKPIRKCEIPIQFSETGKHIS